MNLFFGATKMQMEEYDFMLIELIFDLFEEVV